MNELMMSSRRTIMSGEVVTFATGFKYGEGVLGGHDPIGPFDVSASRDAVVVHRAEIRSPEQAKLFVAAILAATQAMSKLHNRYGQPSLYSREPTPVPITATTGETQ